MNEQNKPPAWLIPSKVYDVLKWIGLIVCPALATLTLTVGNAVGIPCTAEIATCITAAGTQDPFRNPCCRNHREYGLE